MVLFFWKLAPQRIAYQFDKVTLRLAGTPLTAGMGSTGPGGWTDCTYIDR